jgi:hypothetical protein
MVRSGVSLTSYHGVFCWHKHGRQHPLRAEELKDWLNSKHATFLPHRAEISKAPKGHQNKSFHSYLHSRGIVAFLNFWGANNQGDHIDLWNGKEIAHGDHDFFERSEQIWFWRLP